MTGNGAQVLQDISLPDAEGQKHRLGDYWKAQRTLLLFIRHFG